jgi:hypothetical protein
MASYFDVQPQPKSTAAEIDLQYGDKDESFPRESLLTPQVSRILDDLEGGSSSGESDTASDPGSAREEDLDEDTGIRKNPIIESLHQTKTSPSPDGKAKAQEHPFPRLKRHPRLERFVSLRSSLLSSRIADNMSKCAEQKQGGQGLADLDHSQSSNSSMEASDTARRSSDKGTLAQRMGKTLRRLTGSNVPTLKGIQEGSESTDPSGKAAQTQASEKRDSGQATDDDDLAHWRSRVDPPSDGSPDHAREDSKNTPASGSGHDRHESLEPENVDELVRWISRKPEPTDQTPTNQPGNSLEASTESDSNDGNDKTHEELEDGDIDDIVRWISNNRQINEDYRRAKENKMTSKLQHGESHHSVRSSHAPETSEESEILPRLEPQRSQHPPSEFFLTTQEDNASSLADEDVPELIRTVTRDESTHDDEKRRDAAILRWKIEKERQARSGVVDKPHRGEPTEEDIDELVNLVSRRASVGGGA